MAGDIGGNAKKNVHAASLNRRIQESNVSTFFLITYSVLTCGFRFGVKKN